MTPDPSAGASLARRRWDRPEYVERRIARLIADIAKLPPLTSTQRANLIAAIRTRR